LKRLVADKRWILHEPDPSLWIVVYAWKVHYWGFDAPQQAVDGAGAGEQQASVVFAI
jgi:hypothetical protein